MNKTELVAAMAEKTGLIKKDTENALKAFTDIVTDEITNGRKVQMSGFGVFDVIHKEQREGRNPKTGESLTIPACKSPKFKASKTLKELVNA